MSLSIQVPLSIIVVGTTVTTLQQSLIFFLKSKPNDQLSSFYHKLFAVIFTYESASGWL